MSALLFLLCLASNVPHAGSVSRTWVELRSDGLQLRAELQVLSLLEILPGLDADGDGFVDPKEVTGKTTVLGRYLTEHYRLLADGELIVPGPFELRLLPPAPGSFLPLPEWVEVRFEAPLAGLPDTLEVRSSLFTATSPDHRDLFSLRWPGHLSVHGVIDGVSPTGRFEPGPRLLPLALRAAFVAAIAEGMGPLLALAVLLGWSSARMRLRHGLMLMAGAGMAGLVLGLLGREAAVDLYGAHLWPLALPLLGAYCAADRVAFGMQAGHGLEAFAGGLLWGLTAGLAWLRASQGWELQDWPLAWLPILAPLALAGGVWLLASRLHAPLQARAGRGVLGLAGAASLGLFALHAFA